MATKKTKINETKFVCIFCDFNTSKKTDFNRHTQTHKHISNVLATSSNEKNDKAYKCELCDKVYIDRSGLWRHKKRCTIKNNLTDIEEKDNTDKDLILMLVKQNSDLMEVIKNGTHNNTNSHNTTNNSHNNNKTFNLNLFLNETCKDAMNITDFVESIQLQLSDLENVGKLGYVEGITNIITSHLKALEVNKRPIHCTDKKREILYIKDENKWEKEDEEKIKIRKVIKRVSNKNARLLPKFREVHPDCNKSSSLYSDQYNKIIVESMGGQGDNDLEKEDKIIKNISKTVTLDK
jgi:hypothetical protein